MRVIRLSEAKRLALPGRTSHEIVSAAQGATGVTLRRVEIPVATSAHAARAKHRHADFEECIHVLSGRGMTSCEGNDIAVGPGDTILVPPGELHATRNIGEEPLVLLCFFPVGDIRPGTDEPSPTATKAP